MDCGLSIIQAKEREKDRVMVRVIQGLPDGTFQLKPAQRPELEIQRNFWRWVGAQIDYWQYLQIGGAEDPSKDPRQDPSLPPVAAEHLMVFARYHFYILRLLIADPTGSPITGFSIIKDWAKSQGKDFPFSSPRELFAQICRDQANSGFSNSLEGWNSGIEDLKKNLRLKKALLKDRLEDDDTEAILKSWEADDWSLKWIPPIYRFHRRNRRNNRIYKPIKPYWDAFDRANNELTKFICRPASKHREQGVDLFLTLRLKGGRTDGLALHPKTKEPLHFQI